MVRTECKRTIYPNSTLLSLRSYCSATNIINIVDKTITKMLDKFTTPGSSVIPRTQSTSLMCFHSNVRYKYIQPGQVSPHKAEVVLVFPFLLHIHFVDTKLEFHVPFYSKFFSGMMQAIQIHNTQHDDVELVLSPQCLDATMVQLECCRHRCCQPKF